MSWQTECTRILRFLIDDLESTPEYSDDRLQETLLVAAQYVMQDVDLSVTYTVDVDQLTLSPDPTSSPKDDVMINLMCLKAGCIVDKSRYRSKIKTAGIMVKDGQSTIDTRGVGENYKVLLDKGLCAEYEQAKIDYQLGDNNPGRIILGPASGPGLPDIYHNYPNERC